MPETKVACSSYCSDQYKVDFLLAKIPIKNSGFFMFNLFKDVCDTSQSIIKNC
jgi:hypothetical protein